jgi:hypothetical protein
LNTAFHALTGLAIGQTAAGRLLAAEREEPAPHLPDDARLLYVRVAVYTFLLCVMSHGVLDGLPHEYPFRALGDTLWTLGLFFGWMLFIQPRFRPLLVIAFVGAEMPDLVDHVPRDLNRHLHLHLPVLPKLFPWHYPGGSGSLSGYVPPMARIASLVNHVMVVTFGATLMWLSRNALRAGPR